MAEAHSYSGSPTVRRRELGTLLRALRTERGLTVEQVSAQLLCSPSKVSRMETGQRGATPRDVRDLCDLYEVTGTTERERLMRLAREGKQQGWWQSFGLAHQAYVGLEQDATALTIFQSSVVPGLLQIAEYIRAVHQVGIPRLDEQAIEERVEERKKRQQILNKENPPKVEIILDEAVLHRLVGGLAVMRKQLDHLIEVSGEPNINLRIVPYSVGAHPALESNFTILEFSGLAPTTVHAEGLAGQLYLERPSEVERYLLALEVLRGLALSADDSIQFAVQMHGSYAVG